MPSLAEIRAKLKTQKTSKGGGDKTLYIHWNMDFDKSCRIRFLPDANKENVLFWVTKREIKLPFKGIKGGSHDDIEVKVPCMEMWEKTGSCRITAELRPWFNKENASYDPSLEATGRKYWPKKTHIFQGFVRENPINEEDPPENPIRKFVFSKQIFDIIDNTVENDPDMVNNPVDFKQGTDFRIMKTRGPSHADYTTSKFVRNESELTQEEEDAIAKYGLWNLTDSMPKKPTEEDQKIMWQMFNESLEGLPWDPDKYEKHYSPFGWQVGAGNKTETSSFMVPEKAKSVDVANLDSGTTETETKTESAPSTETSSPSVDAPTTDAPPDMTNAPATTSSDVGSKSEDILAELLRRKTEAGNN